MSSNTELEDVITLITKGITNKENYITKIKHPLLLLHSLIEFDKIIGQTLMKTQIAKCVLKLLGPKIRGEDETDNDMMHSLIYGPPGTGKTECATRIAKIFYSIGFGKKDNKKRSNKEQSTSNDFTELMSSDLSQPILILTLVLFMIGIITGLMNLYTMMGMWKFIFLVFILAGLICLFYWFFMDEINFNMNESDSSDEKSIKSLDDNLIDSISDEDVIRITSRDDFIGRYVGWTENQTNKILNESLGKVLFIDEAYSLNNGKDGFGQIALDIINRFMTEHSGEIIIIFAGYEDKIKKHLFRAQNGLERRFTQKFYCSGYNIDELFDIFMYHLEERGKKKKRISNPWRLSDIKESKKVFIRNKDAFPNYAGDVTNLIMYCKMHHDDYAFKTGDYKSKSISISQLENAFESLRANGKTANNEDLEKDNTKLGDILQSIL